MITWEIDGREVKLETGKDLFSPEAIDRGTLAMLSVTEIKPDDKVLDLGCGYGTVGIYAILHGHVRDITMVDINSTAVEISRKNLQSLMSAENNESDINFSIDVSDGLKEVKDYDYSLIMTHPPYHTDFSVAKHFIEDGFKHLIVGGRMVMVTKRRTWYENKLKSVFGGVKIVEVDGYYVFTSQKRDVRYPKKEKKCTSGLSKKLERKQRNKKRL